MKRDCGQGEHAAEDGVPVEESGVGTGAPVGPEGEKEVVVGTYGNATDDVTEGGSEEDGEQNAGEGEESVEEGAPEWVGGVAAELDADAAQNEQPEHHNEREIEAAEGRGIEQREGEEECATGSEQPDFVAVPDRADGAKSLSPFGLGACDKEVDDADAEVETVKDDVGGGL